MESKKWIDGMWWSSKVNGLLCKSTFGANSNRYLQINCCVYFTCRLFPALTTPSEQWTAVPPVRERQVKDKWVLELDFYLFYLPRWTIDDCLFFGIGLIEQVPKADSNSPMKKLWSLHMNITNVSTAQLKLVAQLNKTYVLTIDYLWWLINQSLSQRNIA